MYINNIKRTVTLLAICVFMLAAAGAKAQVKSYLGFDGGISSPEGDFKQTDYSNNKAGFAKRGVVLGLDGAYYIYKGFGIGGSFSFQDQGELTQNDVNNLATGYTASFKADQSDVVSVGRYHSYSLFIGPQYSFTYKSLILDLRASAGYLRVKSTPVTTMSLVGVVDQTTDFTQNSGGGYVFGYSGSVGLRYKISDGFFVSLKGNYIDSQGPKITNSGRQTDIGRIVTMQPMNVFQTTLGLSFGF